MGRMEPVACTRCKKVQSLAEFYVRKGKRVTQCKGCYQDWHRARYKPKHGTDDSPRECVTCGESYQPKTRRVSFYCSRACLAAARKPRQRDEWLKVKYGIGEAEFDEILVAQGGGCAICGALPGAKGRFGVLHLDHDHVSGVVRGVLCQRCNHGLGNFADDTDRMLRAVEYLKAHALA